MTGRDDMMMWKTGRLYVSAKELAGMDNNGSSDISLSQGTPTMEPATTIETTCIPMTTADEVSDLRGIPWDLDRNEDVQLRLHLQHCSGTAGAPVFKFFSKFFADGDSLVEFFANEDVSAQCTASMGTTDGALELTPWTSLNWDDALGSSDVSYALGIELDALGGCGADECKLLGYELKYTREAVHLDGKQRATDGGTMDA